MSLFNMRLLWVKFRALKSCITTLAAVLVVLSMPYGVSAQTATGILRGTVSDPDTAIIPGAQITLAPTSGSPVLGKSASDGTFRIVAPAGTYVVTVSMPGFATYSKAGVKIGSGQSVALDARLIVGEETQIINVTSDATTVGVDSDANASSTVIKGKDLDALSDDPDELSSELSALAGPAAGPNGGQIYVDGFTGGQLPPKSSIREIRINQNPFSAQYDRLGYGRVEVFTKPGTDKFHGSLSTQGNTGAFNTSTPFLGSTNNQPGYYTFFLLGNVTGPLTKTSSFSVGGSRRTINQNAIINPTGFYATSATSTTLCAPGQVGCASYPFPASARALLQPQLRQDITPRLDFALGSKNVLTTRYQYEGDSNTNGGIGTNRLPTAGFNSSSAEHTIQVSDTQTVSPRVVNESRFEYQRENSDETALSNAPSLNVQGVFNGGGSSAQNSHNVRTHIEVQNYTSFAAAKHFLRFGGRLRTTNESLTSNSGSNGSFTYSYLLDPCTDPGLTNKPATCVNTTVPCSTANISANPTANGATYFSSYECALTAGYGPSQVRLTTINTPTVSARQTDLGVYAEDDWKLRSNLTLSMGLRFEAQNAINSSHDFAPRVSVAYGVPRGDGKSPITVLRGGFGIFYDRFGLGDLLTVQQYAASGPAQSQATVSSPGVACQPGSITACFTGTGTSSSLRTIYSLAPNLRSAYTMQGAIGMDQQIGRIGTISVNYLTARGNHEYLTRLNRTAANGNTPGAYNYQLNSAAVFNQQQLLVNANLRTRTVTLFGFYAFGVGNSNSSGSGFIPTSNDPRVDYGRASFNNRHFSVSGATWTAPFKITVSPFLIIRSGIVYNVTTGTDINGDSIFNERPAFKSGVAANCSSANTFDANPSTSYTEIPINYCTGPTNVSANLRVGRAFGFGPKIERANGAASGGGPGGPRGMPGFGGGGGGRGGGGPFGGGGASTGRRYTLNLGAQAMNIFNIVPYLPPISTLSNAQFGRYTSLAGRPFSSSNAVRTVTLQATLNF